MQEALDDIIDRLDQNDSDQQDANDSISQSLDDLSTRSDDLDNRVGQLDFPLSEDSIARIKEVFPADQVTLSAGSVTKKDQRIGTYSTILFNVYAISGTPGFLSYTLATGSVTFHSTSASDSSVIKYVIF